MAVAFEVGICDLLPKFLADALILLRTSQAAGAIAAGALEPLPDGLHHFFVLVQSYSHGFFSFIPQISVPPPC